MKLVHTLIPPLAALALIACSEKTPVINDPQLIAGQSSAVIPGYSLPVDPGMSSAYVDPGLSAPFYPGLSSFVDPAVSSAIIYPLSSNSNPYLSSSATVIYPISSAIVLVSSSAAALPSSSSVNSGTQACGGKMPPKISGGTSGWGSRYWDCCKPSCSWHEKTIKLGTAHGAARNCSIQNTEIAAFTPMDGGSWFKGTVNACDGGEAYTCYGNVPWAVCDNLSYGFAAGKLGEVPCGKCYQLDFTGSSHKGSKIGQAELVGKSMIVMISNHGGDVESGQLDLMIPGGGVGMFERGCKVQWNTTSEDLLGAGYGGFRTKCQQKLGESASLAQYKTCVLNMCTALFGTDPSRADLLAGCKWYAEWLNAVDNPNFVSKEVDCPDELVQKYRSTISN